MKKSVENEIPSFSLPTGEELGVFFNSAHNEGVTRGPDFLMYKPARRSTKYSNIPTQINVSDIVLWKGQLWKVLENDYCLLTLENGANKAYLVGSDYVEHVQS